MASPHRELTADARTEAWRQALFGNAMPGFVVDRLRDAGEGRTPWLTTLRPAELLVVRSHGVRPLATVCGSGWFDIGEAWSNGHAQAWKAALARLSQQAKACGAHAVVDVRLRLLAGPGRSVGYSLVGVAVRVGDLPPNPHPLLATVTALEFARLAEAGVAPTGIVVGAEFRRRPDPDRTAAAQRDAPNRRLVALSNLWEAVQRVAITNLRREAVRLGGGVLAHAHHGELHRQLGGEAPEYLCGYIVVGTVLDVGPDAPVLDAIESVVDVRSDRSPLERRPPELQLKPEANTEQQGAKR